MHIASEQTHQKLSFKIKQEGNQNPETNKINKNIAHKLHSEDTGVCGQEEEQLHIQTCQLGPDNKQNE